MSTFLQRIWERLEGDRLIWAIVLVLSMFSIMAVYSSTGTLAYKYQAGNTEYYLLKHISLLLFSLVLMYIAHLVPYRFYAKVAKVAMYVSIPLLAYTLLFGTDLNDAKRWITLPVINFSFQTSDLAKLALIMYLARILTIKQDNINDLGIAFIPTIIPVILVCGLIAPADLSTALVLFCTSILLMFIGRVNWKHILGLGAMSIVAGALFISLLFALPDDVLQNTGRMATWKSRIEAFAEGDNADSYQVKQAKIAIAKGGITGAGPGKSVQRNFLPHPYSDFIYAIILEEYGTIGGAFIMFLYLAFLFRSIKIVTKSPKAFGALLAVGLSMSLVIQALIHMAVAVNLLPVTGLTLPLISMGGTSLFFTSVSVGIVLSVSRSIEKDSTLKESEPEAETPKSKRKARLATA